MTQKALKMARRAINNLIAASHLTDPQPWRDARQDSVDALISIEEALAQPSDSVEQEPVATITITQRGAIRIVDNNFDDCVREWPDGEYKLYTSPPAQPEQEPVACVQDLDEVKRKHLVYEKGMDWKDPLYTSPPQRKPLTEDKIEKVWQMVESIDFRDCVLPFARAIEAKLKEKT